MDEPEHKLHRALVAPAFRQKMLARWESELVEAVVDELLDRITPVGRSDLVRDLTFAFPAQVIARILGLPRSDYTRFQRWSLELISVAANWDRGIAASEALRDYFAEVLIERRKAPSDDLITDLAVAEVDGQQLSDEEIFGFLRLLLPAGVETTYRSSGNLLFALLTHPDQLDAVRRDRRLVPPAIEEALRWEPPLTSIVRRAKKDITLGGVDIPAGADVGVCLAAANRDERRFPEPDRFDIFREPRPHASFGSGPHMCIGMHLARMETRVAVNRALDRLDDLRLDPDGNDVHIHGMAFRSPTSLPVLFTPA
jgi:cytochrome P450